MQPLPTSVQAGKPLPTTEEPQDDLSNADYQSIAERFVNRFVEVTTDIGQRRHGRVALPLPSEMAE